MSDAAEAIRAKKINVTVTVRPPETDTSRIVWHRFGARCWAAVQLYQAARILERLANRVDPARRHMA